MGEQQEEEKKDEEKKEEEEAEIVLRVEMHCEGCARKVEKSLRKCEGVERVEADSKLRKVIVRGKGADPVKLCERLQKKTGRRAEVISPLPKPPEEQEAEKKEETPPPAAPEQNQEEPKPITVVLKIRMHCEACAQVLQKRIKKMEGVESVEPDVANDQVTVKGFIDPGKLVESVYRRTRRQASIVTHEEEKKEEEAKKEEPEKKEEEPAGDGDGEKKGDEGDDAKKMESWPPKYYLPYSYAYPAPDQVFSDENPNACHVM